MALRNCLKIRKCGLLASIFLVGGPQFFLTKFFLAPFLGTLASVVSWSPSLYYPAGPCFSSKSTVAFPTCLRKERMNNHPTWVSSIPREPPQNLLSGVYEPNLWYTSIPLRRGGGGAGWTLRWIHNWYMASGPRASIDKHICTFPCFFSHLSSMAQLLHCWDTKFYRGENTTGLQHLILLIISVVHHTCGQWKWKKWLPIKVWMFKQILPTSSIGHV